jgi:maltooligosyltrehalose trehalohydrolase
VWAPKRRRVHVVIAEGTAAGEYPLDAEADGYFAGAVAAARAGTLYRYRLDDDRRLHPDPASRFQPAGVTGPSEVIDPAFPWTDAGWRGITRAAAPLSSAVAAGVIYEMHLGTFTREGTWESAAGQLTDLADLGVTVLEIMPVSEFPGAFGWGYDGVFLFAPTRLYGRPDDFRRFVDRAHEHGLAVILDVVYNHLGPDGNGLRHFSDTYFTNRYENEWGEAINFDDDAAPVRELFASIA